MAELEKFESGESIYDPDFREKLNALVDSANAASGASTVEPDIEFMESVAEIGIPVELTARTTQGGGLFQFKEKIYSGGVWTDKAGGLTHTELGACRAMGGPPTAPAAAAHIGDVVYIYPKCIPNSDKVVYEFHVAPKLFPVDLTTASGSDGIYNTSAPTYTYDAKDKDANTIATNLSPEIGRDKAPVVATATEGLAYIDTDGSWKLAWCNEVCDHSRGYYQMEGGGSDSTATQAGGTASEVSNANGKIFFCAPGGGTGDTGTMIPVYTRVLEDDPAAGTDKVVQWIDSYDVTGGGSDLNGVTFIDVEIRADDTVSTGTWSPGFTAGTAYTIDDSNYSGRVFDWTIDSIEDDTVANWQARNNTAIDSSAHIGETYASDYSVYASAPSSIIRIFVDQSDSYKLKVLFTSAPTTNQFHFARVMIQKGERKTAADLTFP